MHFTSDRKTNLMNDEIISKWRAFRDRQRGH